MGKGKSVIANFKGCQSRAESKLTSSFAGRIIYYNIDCETILLIAINWKRPDTRY